MRPAQDALNDILHKIEIRETSVTDNKEKFECDVYSNVTGNPFGHSHDNNNDNDDIRDLLTRQLCETVRWCDVMKGVNKRVDGGDHVGNILELGPGNQLKSILSKMNRKLVRNTKTIDLSTSLTSP